ncbi:MAG TPA: Fe-S-containing hydro-lyase [Firmicutes bacterium]|nr:Fe-S-containing hydro-lyase [Bacillota bacterium]
MSEVLIHPPLDDETVKRLHAGDTVSISGVIYTGRDAAHKRLVELIRKGEELPVDLKGQIIYYVGPTPARPGCVPGAAGPTTSTRMDAYTPALLERGLKAMIGKGQRSPQVVETMKKHTAVYLAAVGGAAALIAKKIKKVEVVAYEDLGPEAIYRFHVEGFPAIVVIDCYGNNLYETEPQKYARN